MRCPPKPFTTTRCQTKPLTLYYYLEQAQEIVKTKETILEDLSLASLYSPLTKEITATIFFVDFSMTEVSPYEGGIDPIDPIAHLENYGPR